MTRPCYQDTVSTAELRAHFVSNMGKMLLLDLITKIHGEIPANSGDCSASLSLSALRFMVGPLHLLLTCLCKHG